MMWRVLLCFVAIATVLTPSACASAITIDFEHFPGVDGILGTVDDIPVPSGFVPITNQFSSLGITFSSPTGIFNGVWNPGHFVYGRLLATLSVPVYRISAEVWSVNTLTIEAFDSSGDLLDSDALPLGHGFVQVQSSTPISSFVVVTTTLPGTDNLTLDGSAPVPEPGTLLLISTGLFGLGGTIKHKIAS